MPLRARAASQRPIVPTSLNSQIREVDKSGTEAGTAGPAPSRPVLAPLSGMAERLWSWKDVEERIAEAFETVAALPEPRNSKPGKVRALWPDYSDPRDRQALIDMVGLKNRMRPAVPSARAITEAEEAIGWLLWLTDDYQRKLAVLRGLGFTWPKIIPRLGWSQRKLQYDHRGAMIYLSTELNAGRR
jgi:hypothetical protein